MKDLHPCSAKDCPNRTPYSWCRVHSPREFEREHRRKPRPQEKAA